jgi:hypothetical protein
VVGEDQIERVGRRDGAFVGCPPHFGILLPRLLLRKMAVKTVRSPALPVSLHFLAEAGQLNSHGPIGSDSVIVVYLPFVSAIAPRRFGSDIVCRSPFQPRLGEIDNVAAQIGVIL